ncbi:hypothetical protein B0H10DRAFT_2215224 [Mycena sp. CBHHK59/15]|nr:hypothetical protein B0H10DRAFT_2215224 [Mycena sp. CBHHK59/15]
MHHSSTGCVPPYHASAGHDQLGAHDNASACLYYVVWAGWVRGVWISRAQTDGYTGALAKSFKQWNDTEEWWCGLCTQHHMNGCPPFEAVNFTLNPPSNTHPTSAPCSRLPAPAITSAASRPAPVSATAPRPAPPRPAPPPPLRPRLPWTPRFACSLPGRLRRSVLRTLRCRSFLQLLPPPKKEEPASPHLHLNVPPRVTPLTRVQLTPTGVARAATIAATRAAADAAPPASHAPAAANPTCGAANLTDPDCPSVLVTPAPAAADANTAPALPLQYGVRGVSMFYPTYHAAYAAAMSLGIAEPKIMVSRNIAKLEAWILGLPFEGEDDNT